MMSLALTTVPLTMYMMGHVRSWTSPLPASSWRPWRHPRAENEGLAHPSQRRRVLRLRTSPSSTSPSESSQPGDGNRESDNQRIPGKQNTPESSVSAAVAASSSAAAAAAAHSPRTRASRRQRMQVAGVSVSPSGFHVVLQKNSTHYLPLRATDDSAGADREAATSPQALTLLQLLARVDMAGAILPPDVLSRIVVLSLEDDDDDAKRRRLREQEEGNDGSEGGGGVGDRVRGEPSRSAVGSRVLALVGERLAKLEAYGGTPGATTYGELHEYPWLQSRVLLPTVTLDGLVLSLPPPSCVSPTPAYALECSVKNLPGGGPSSLSVELTEGVCERVSYEYRPLGISRTFIALALALRYRAPIELVQPPDGGEAPGGSSSFLTLDQVRERFPLYRTSDQLRQTPERVATNIERGLKVNQLQAALRVALQREDFAAAAKIRAALDEMDSLQDLPTQEESDTGSMQ